MKLDLDLRHVCHRHGGRITHIDRIEHLVDRPKDGHSRDSWHFVGNVTWDDGSQSTGLQIAPWALVYADDSAESRTEVDGLLRKLTEYLAEHGQWCESGSHRGWYAHRRST